MAEIERHEDKDTGVFDLHLALRLLRYLKPYRLQAAASLVLMILSSLAEVAGPAIIAIAIDLFVKPLKGEHPIGVSGDIGAWLAAHGWTIAPLTGIDVAALLYLLSLGANFGILYLQMVVMSLMGQYFMYDLRNELFGHLQKLDIQYFDRNPVGGLMTRVTFDIDAINDMFTAGFVTIVGDVLVLAGIVCILFWMNWRMALVLFSITPLILLVSIWFRRGARPAYRRVRMRVAAINAFLQEHITGMSTVQLFNREETERQKFDRLNVQYRDANIDAIFYAAIVTPLVELIEMVGVALIVWYGGRSVIRGTLSIGALVAFFTYAQRFYEPISDLSEKYTILQAAMAASERVFELLDTEVQIKDTGILEVGPIETIEFRDVWFAYNDGADAEWVLKGVSFTVRRGERVALVGHTGAGKTTVTALLLRFYEAQRGQILIDGIDIRRYTLASLRALFAVVQQDFFLFTGNVAQNISLGDPGISDEAVREAAVRVQADRFIARLRRQYQSDVRERGAGFSVGEKQLLSFARALAFDPPVLILDEATSSIDTETELLIQRAIHVLMEGRTSIVIAHRLSTIRSANSILVFHHGEIRERGTHEELMRLDGLYRKLYEIQYRESIAATA